MYLSEDYVAAALHRAAEQRMLRDLERRRVIAERAAETAEAAAGVTDAARPRRGIRALLPRRLGPLMPPRPLAS
ncbi:hypothetical protein LQ757_12085 [Agromyces sp. SYSU K20354]|uniref:hypothetical protein n=1 Tax=Agromyces cavernae TaxID=2898659 RepID=UPI001E440070|nr:hypothetical protein [Agromyces cavernae]MCD2443012.1 hypothetical protein [Agromyces cavernae]